MTNQPTDNEWKYKAFTEFMSEKNAQDFDKAIDLKTQIEFMLKYFIEAIDNNIPKPTEVVAPVEPINQERLREIKEKYQLRLERNRKERDKTSIEWVSEILTKEFVEDLQSLHQSLPQSEQERVVEIEKYKWKCECWRYIRYGMDYKYCYGCWAKIKRVS